MKHLAPGKLDDKYDEDRPFRWLLRRFQMAAEPGPHRAAESASTRLSCVARRVQDVVAPAARCIANDVDGNVLILAALAAGECAYVRHDPFVWAMSAELALLILRARPSGFRCLA